jgi:hypothetical protein
MIAAAAKALSSLSVVGNANRLRRHRPAPLAPVTVIGPVCGMSVDPTTAPRDRHEHRLHLLATLRGALRRRTRRRHGLP